MMPDMDDFYETKTALTGEEVSALVKASDDFSKNLFVPVLEETVANEY